MINVVAGIVPSEVDPRHFDLLLDGTSMRGKKVIEALRDHLVIGLLCERCMGKTRGEQESIFTSISGTHGGN